MGVVRSIARNVRVVDQLVRTSVQTQAQYRADFITEVVLAFFWAGWEVAPLWLIFELRDTVAGWTRPEAMLVMSAFLILKAILEGLIMPNVNQLVVGIRSGSFDFVLLKPADAQLMMSFSKVLPAKIINLAAGVALGAWSVAALEPTPHPVQVFVGVLMLFAGALSMYALWLAAICTAFWWVKIDNMSFLFSSVFDAARWPISVFRGWVRAVLTFVIPLAVMTSYPALAVLGRPVRRHRPRRMGVRHRAAVRVPDDLASGPSLVRVGVVVAGQRINALQVYPPDGPSLIGGRPLERRGHP